MFSPLTYRRLIIHTSLTTEKAASILSSALGSQRSKSTIFKRLRGGAPEFVGTVDTEGFTIKRSYSYWLSGYYAVPLVLYGRFKSRSYQTEIDVRITVGPLATACLLVFFFAGAFEILSYLKLWALTKSLDSGLGFTLLVMLIAYAIFTLSFNNQADLAEDFIDYVYHRHRSR